MGSVGDLDRARKHLQELAKASQIGEYRMIWQDFLYRLELVWEKSRRRFGREAWFPNFHGPYRQLQKKDQLLRYLQHARHAETHTIEGTLSSSLEVRIRDRYGIPFSIRDFKSRYENGVWEVCLDTHEIDFDADISVFRGGPELVRFISRGTWYNPPNLHLGNRIDSRDPVCIGNLGLEFVSGFVRELETKIN